MATGLHIKRIYEPAEPADGCRVLVDRVWPRGLSRDAAKIDHWLKEIGPSTELRKWFGHRPERFETFAQRYREELGAGPQLQQLRELAAAGPLTLLYSARDTTHNQAVVLVEVLRERLGMPKT